MTIPTKKVAAGKVTPAKVTPAKVTPGKGTQSRASKRATVIATRKANAHNRFAKGCNCT